MIRNTYTESRALVPIRSHGSSQARLRANGFARAAGSPRSHQAFDARLRFMFSIILLNNGDLA